MKTVDFTIDQTDLLILYGHSRHAYGNISFEDWCSNVKTAYARFVSGKENPKTFSQWINGQIIYLTT